MELTLDYGVYEDLARRTVAESIVMLKNENGTLPFRAPMRIALYGRIQSKEYIAGIGSGGLVNIPKRVRVLDGLAAEQGICLDETLRGVYERWEEEHPREVGIGWGKEPWSQKEMPVSEELARDVAARTDAAVILIGRSAGEDQDNRDTEGSYRLTETEREMIRNVSRACSRTVVLLNTGNILDMSFLDDEASPQAVLYIWQGGVMMGAGVADVLTGRVSPSGHLADTIAYGCDRYPADANFGDVTANYYREDIYVGYRHFETAARDDVRFPFGYGLSYTRFETERGHAEYDGEYCYVSATVKNVGEYSGKCVLQCYVSAPQGALGKPARVLAGFLKTEELAPGESETVVMTIDKRNMASYDDSGATGYPDCFVMEAGEYRICLGENVRSAENVLRFTLNETEVIEHCPAAMKPVLPFERRKPSEALAENGNPYGYETEAVPTQDDGFGRGEAAPVWEEPILPYCGDKGLRLTDVANGAVSMEEFLAQFTEEELFPFVRGEGMGSPKVTPGTASAFGGTSRVLKEHGVPCGCCSDGPSGLRMDCGSMALAIPIGTAIACTFNRELAADLLECVGLEMRYNRIDCLLGPGMNLHRHPLNGRNFEYFSEDPYLTGQMAAAELEGLQRVGVTGTLKHFCGNNQETNRYNVDAVVSERALRELYLRGFEIAVREGGACTVMTTYGRVNGMWTSCDYGLNTTILREQWGFDGFVMTDWWAAINVDAANGRREPSGGSHTNFADMLRAQNDTYMVCPDGSANHHGDNLAEGLADGRIQRADLVRTASNVCRVLMRLPAMERMLGEPNEVTVTGRGPEWSELKIEDVEYFPVSDDTVLDLSGVATGRGKDYSYGLEFTKLGGYEVELTAIGEGTEAAQLPVTWFCAGIPVFSFVYHGSCGKPVTKSGKVYINGTHAVHRLHFSQDGLKLVSLRVRYLETLEEALRDPDFVHGN